VAPFAPSDKTRKKAATHRTEDGFPVQSFRSLLADLGTLCRNVMRTGGEKGSEFSMLTQPSPLQQKAFSLLGLSPNL
jgi:hypothetical protein